MRAESQMYLTPEQNLERGTPDVDPRYWALPKRVRLQVDVRFGGDFDAAERYVRSTWRGRGDTPEWARLVRAVARRTNLS